MQATGRKKWIFWVGLGLVFLFTFPMFFDIYREAAFNITPHDDYAPYLLYLVHQGGTIPSAPYVYRIFSVVAAIPFYFLLPSYSFTNLTAVDANYLQAVEALAALAYLCTVLCGVMVFLLARRRFGASILASLVVGWMSFFLMEFMSQIGIDPLTLLTILVLLYFCDNPWVFIPLLIVSIAINEKVPLLFAILSFFRVLETALARRKKVGKKLLALWATSWVALGGYFLLRALAPVAGYENQTNLTTFGGSLLRTLQLSASLKGLVQNVLPVLVGAILAVGYAMLVARKSGDLRIYRSDAWVFVVFLGLALVLDVLYTVGRLVLFTYPVFLPGLALWLDEVFQPKDAVRATGSAG